MNGNITIITIIYVIFLIVPGVFFKRFYYQGPFNKQFGRGNFADRLVTSLWLGLVVQILTFIFLSNAFHIEFNSVIEFIRTSLSKINDNQVPDLTKEIVVNLLLYFVVSVIFSIVFGHICHKGIRLFKLDVKNPVWRFSNEWHYYFTGETISGTNFKFTGGNSNKTVTSIIDLEVLFGEGENTFISGMLADYLLSSDGNLESIILNGAKRRYTKKVSFGNKKHVEENIPGDCFIIPYNQVANMNVQYVYNATDESKNGNFPKLKKISQIIIFLLLPIIFVLPWFTDASVADKFLGVFFLFLSWLLINVIYSNVLLKNSKLTSKEIFLVALFSLIFFISALYILHILPSINLQLFRFFSPNM